MASKDTKRAVKEYYDNLMSEIDSGYCILTDREGMALRKVSTVKDLLIGYGFGNSHLYRSIYSHKNTFYYIEYEMDSKKKNFKIRNHQVNELQKPYPKELVDKINNKKVLNI